MEPAGLGVILDSSVVIEAERRHLNVAQFLRQMVQKIGETEVAICVITVADWRMGSIARTPRSDENAAGLSLMN